MQARILAESRLVDELAVRAEVEEAFEKEILMTYHLRRNVSAATAALSALASAGNTTRDAGNTTLIPVYTVAYSIRICTSIIHACQRYTACACISAHSASAGNATRIAVYNLI